MKPSIYYDMLASKISSFLPKDVVKYILVPYLSPINSSLVKRVTTPKVDYSKYLNDVIIHAKKINVRYRMSTMRKELFMIQHLEISIEEKQCITLKDFNECIRSFLRCSISNTAHETITDIELTDIEDNGTVSIDVTTKPMEKYRGNFNMSFGCMVVNV